MCLPLPAQDASFSSTRPGAFTFQIGELGQVLSRCRSLFVRVSPGPPCLVAAHSSRYFSRTSLLMIPSHFFQFHLLASLLQDSSEGGAGVPRISAPAVFLSCPPASAPPPESHARFDIFFVGGVSNVASIFTTLAPFILKSGQPHFQCPTAACGRRPRVGSTAQGGPKARRSADFTRPLTPHGAPTPGVTGETHGSDAV